MGTLSPRVVLVHRRTELEELVARHGTRGQAAYFLQRRGRTLEALEARSAADAVTLATARAGVPEDWRIGIVERGDLDRFLFAPEDIVVVVGQDGLVANVAKALDGQPVIGVNPAPDQIAGVLVRHRADELAGLLRHVADGTAAYEERTMVAARTDDGQELVALNELYLGQPTHQTAWWTLTTHDGASERQASSGLIVATGTGATGWCGSIAHDRRLSWEPPMPAQDSLAWFVREAWPSPRTGAHCTLGVLRTGESLSVLVDSEELVLFGDGIEADRLRVGYGQRVEFSVAPKVLRLV